MSRFEKKILVTGSEGFIGSHLVKALPMNQIHSDPRCHVQLSTVDEILNQKDIKIEAIFHLGAISDTTCDNEKALYDTNVKLSLSLANFCREHRIPFVYASSASVYGNGDGPLNGYARSKADFDRCMEFSGNPWPWYGLRFFNVYGAGEEHKGKQASMVNQLVEQQKRGGPLKLFSGSGQWSRDFIHVNDVVSVMLHMWKALPASGIYDVGTSVPVTFYELAHMVMKLGGTNDAIEWVPFPESIKGKYQFHTQADLRNLRAAGYDKPFLSLEEGIKRLHREIAP